jgi:predicted GTPase
VKVLVAGIGNVGKSTLCETIAQQHPDDTVFIDMDYHRGELPENNRRIIIVQDVRGLESDLTMYSHIIYLLPPPDHVLLWFRRAWAWFSALGRQLQRFPMTKQRSSYATSC